MPNYSVLPLALGLIIFSFLINSMLVVPFIDMLYKLRILRKKEGVGAKSPSLFDKLHDKKAGTPTGGGVLLIITTLLLFSLVFPIASRFGVFVYSAHGLRSELFVIFFTFISFGLLGLSDDLLKIFGKARPGPMGMWIGMGRRTKLAMQCILAAFISFWLYSIMGISILHIPFFDIIIDLGIWFIPFSALVIIFFANAFNFTDGLDGLASGVLVIFLFAYVIIAAGSLDTPLFIFISIWIGAVMAFLYFNIWPARVFLGDAGALSFGATIAVIGLLMGNVVALFIIGGIFVVEAASSAIQILGWKILKRPIFPLAPIHHTLLAIGWEEPKIVMRAWLAAIILAIFGLWLATI